MAMNQVDQNIECATCGAKVPTTFPQAACPACGAPLSIHPSAGEALTPTQRSKLVGQIDTLNEKLVEAGAVNAESAFNLGCVMSSLLVIASGILVYLLAGQNWLVVILTLIMAGLAALWFIILISDIAKRGAIRRTFQKEVEPQFTEFAQSMRMELELLEELAHKNLPETAPLRQHIPPLPEPEEEGEEVEE
jgi:hypothetical protein